MKHYEATPYLLPGCKLGEAPFWDKDHNELRFVDIKAPAIHFVNLEKGPSSHRCVRLEDCITVTANVQGNTGDDEFAFAGRHGFGLMDRRTDKVRWIRRMWAADDPAGNGMRANDGAVDPHGRFFAGAMEDGPDPGNRGVLFCLHHDLGLTRIKERVRIPNGISWGHGYIFFTDSPTRTIVRAPYDVDRATVDWAASEPFYVSPQGCVPDGHAVDENGRLWVALYGAGKVVQLDESGQPTSTVSCSTRCVTCPAICGTRLFITSATEEEADKHPWSVKHQGGVFSVDIGLRPRTPNRFVLDA
ncbi:hypothetical protein K470DRAFT_259696 [Piedraia hortae CBS 480.64]|uniref:SMP-30/Gluconolactonase/LRE-like region domain-containing protein n=1 Tax=Piedraia hortae CBS 480.64 TaxID=1314780 RepID=A0A6A7BT57_9PEZI|nr:hypothetical protein K470DRAFT_259696 [Piedraia hortae CBS 480.64]